MSNILVTGGAGYIGSHCVKRLVAEGHGVTVLDNCGRGHAVAVHLASNSQAKLVRADLHETDKVAAALIENNIDTVFHFAAFAYVGESIKDPLLYYNNNTAGSISLLQAMGRAGTKRMVFSSSCAIYGQQDTVPITEQTPARPINPYGWSKLMTEQAIIDYANANSGFSFAALRYFNVAGSDPEGVIGVDHDPETRIIPIVLKCALGRYPCVPVFGDDYDTPDGTCIRDYIHVNDLVDAHVVVMNTLQDGAQRFYNLGTGNGTSVKQIIEAGRAVTGHPIPEDIAPRRPGDPPQLYADPSKIKNELGWQAKCTDIQQMVADAWGWFKNNPNGYRDKK